MQKVTEPQADEKRSIYRQRLRRTINWVGLTLLALVVLLLAGYAYVSRFGVPRAVADALLKSVEFRGFGIEADEIRLDPDKRAVLRGVEIHRRGTAGPPVARVDKVIVAFDATALLLRRPCLRSVETFNGRIFGGTFTGAATFAPPEQPDAGTRYRLECSGEDLDFASVAGLPADEDGERCSKGRLSLDLTVQGELGAEWKDRVKGQGSLSIEAAQVFTIPLFGGLSSFITKLVPGLSFVLSQNDANCEFVIGDGRIHTDNFTVAGDVFSIKGAGDYLLSDAFDFTVQLKLMRSQTLSGKVVQALTAPFSTLLEFRLKGPREAPEWYHVNFSKDLLKKIGLKGGETR